MTRIEDFLSSTQDMVEENIERKFRDALPVLERWFNGLTRKQLIFWESYWRQFGPSESEGEIFEAIKYTPERQRITKRPSVRKEVVVINGHRVTIVRDLRTGRFARRRGR